MKGENPCSAGLAWATSESSTLGQDCLSANHQNSLKGPPLWPIKRVAAQGAF
jgi:hypothetical protein